MVRAWLYFRNTFLESQFPSHRDFWVALASGGGSLLLLFVNVISAISRQSGGLPTGDKGQAPGAPQS